MKIFKGKAIYNPSGKAGEYSYWACNFYVGCSNGCKYCYLKKGIGARVLGGNKPQLKKCFKDEEDALEIFEKEFKQNIEELRKYGLFFTFTSDPMLMETMNLTIEACNMCVNNNVPVKILTKVDFTQEFNKVGVNQFAFPFLIRNEFRHLIAFGFTLTGHDELEPFASPNSNRIEAMRKLHESGFKTFASIEPIINLDSSYDMIINTLGICDLYKIGLESGKKYNKKELLDFASKIMRMTIHDNKVYFKDSLLKQAGISRESLPVNCVDRNYNMFKETK